MGPQRFDLARPEPVARSLELQLNVNSSNKTSRHARASASNTPSLTASSYRRSRATRRTIKG